MENAEKKSYSHTVHLPKTEFPMRADLPKREPRWLEFWLKERVFERMLDRAAGRDAFTLHDGPPYANGHIHIGHALNKVLKDMAVKSRDMMGRRAPYVPGWDCHGLPIEHALLKEMKTSKRSIRDLPAFRRQARAFAERFIAVQKEEFARLGVFGAWERPYTTMSNAYEAAILRAFRLLRERGYIYRGLKTVSWCVTCETALAEAEVEYKEKTSPSVFAALEIAGGPRELLERPAFAAIWTTTPWTLPANMAVALHGDLEYVLAEVQTAEGPRRLLLASARLEALLEALGAQASRRLAAWKGSELVSSGLRCKTPFGGRDSIALLGEHVSAEEGTGLVHTAPGHGAEDFELWSARFGAKDVLCPVDGSGRFTPEAGEFAGLAVFSEGNPAVIASLKKAGRLLAESQVRHSYQHCWRCKQPIAFRATEQWFLSVGREGLRERLLERIAEVRWFPETGRSRISAMVASRPDWCLSRQRLWGAPIPVLRCAGCAATLERGDVMEALEARVAREGSDFWFERLEEPVRLGEGLEGLDWSFLPKARCGCGSALFKRDGDILDVWVDSGVSWLGALKENPEAGEYPCDLYLEGSDQHRGWFQSSLVLSTALEGRAPYRAVLTHGFVLDDKGRAMHKSLGNVVGPQEVTGKYGADVLRLWVALSDYSEDVRLSDKLLEGPTDGYRKLRNTLKYLLGNVCDFSPKEGLPHARLPELERSMLARLGALDALVREAYEAYAFRRAATALLDFCNLDLSAFYLDVRKDALYTLRADHPVRRGAQSVMWECLTRLARLASPILSFTCEEAWQELRRLAGKNWDAPESVFLFDLAAPRPEWNDPALLERWRALRDFRSLALKAIEAERSGKKLGSSLQALLRVSAGKTGYELLSSLGPEAVAELCIVSEAELERQDGEGFSISVERAPGVKCPRCWRYRRDAGLSKDDPELCARCVGEIA